MALPVAGYLLGIASGDFEERQISKRVVIISEPSILDDASYELENIEKTIANYEAYTGVPYQWGWYKTIMIPKNFIYNGMENALLTFQSTSIISGDQSGQQNADHEIGHSWTGNLVTCMNWDSFWLNEGFTTFLD